jgi:hypothetical protein
VWVCSLFAAAQGDIVGHLPDVPAPALPQLSLPTALPSGLHLPSFLLGAGAALFVAMFAMMLLRRSMKLALGILAVLLAGSLGTGYLTFLRQQVGLAASGVATPKEIVDDARAAAAAMKKRVEQQDAVLKRTEERP